MHLSLARCAPLGVHPTGGDLASPKSVIAIQSRRFAAERKATLMGWRLGCCPYIHGAGKKESGGVQEDSGCAARNGDG